MCLLHVVLNISYLILFLIFKILFLRFVLFFLSADLNIFEKYQQFKDYLSDYETLHCAHYVAHHRTKDFKENGMFDLTLLFHTGILFHYFTFFIPNGCIDRREKTKTYVPNYFCIGHKKTQN